MSGVQGEYSWSDVGYNDAYNYFDQYDGDTNDWEDAMNEWLDESPYMEPPTVDVFRQYRDGWQAGWARALEED